MRTIEAKICLESWDRADAAGRVNQGSVALLNYKRRPFVVPLSAGDSDSVYLFRERSTLVVLSINERFGYCGAQLFDLDAFTPDAITPKRFAPAEVGDVFLQDNVEDTLGPRGLDLTPATIARRLAVLVDA